MRKGTLRSGLRNRGNLKVSLSAKSILFAGLLMILFQNVYGQTTSSYSFVRTSGTYTSISGTGTSIPGVLCDDCNVTGIPIGFTFRYCGVNYTNCAIVSNGVLTLNNTYASCCTIAPSSIAGPWIMAMWTDDDGRAGGGGTPSAWYQTTGTPGSRVFTMEWNDWSVFSINPFHMNWQIKLYEGSNEAQICYGSFVSTPGGVIGIANSTSDYHTLINSASTSVNSSLNISTLPASGSLLTFTPPNTAPTYTGGNPQYLSVCQNSSVNPINSLLQVSDVDPGQILTWTLTTPATNGSVTLGGTQLSTGGSVTPAGFSYTPLAGFVGSDAFAIQVSDGFGGTANVTIIVTVNPAPTAITGTTTVCRGQTTTLSSTTSGGTWTSGTPAVATVGGGTGVVTGVASGTAAITYTLGTCITTTTVTVIGTPVITSLSSYVAAPGTSITISGNDFNASTTNNYVYFGATRATVTAASNTSLTATVPVGSTYMPIVSVENNACAFTGYAPYLFLPTYNNTGFVPGTVNFDQHVAFASGSGPYGVAVGDIDGDGKSDVVVANYFSNTISVYRNTSSSGSITTGSLAAKVDFTTAGNPFAIAINDMDGDGKLDVVVSVSGANVVSVFRNTATSGSITGGSLAAGVDFATGTFPAGLDVGDIDGDGKPDIVIANTVPNTVSIIRNTSVSGSITIGSFAPKVDFATGGTPYGVAIGDIDGDGKRDIAVTNNAANTVSLFHNTATAGVINGASLAAKVDFATASNPWNIKIADIDGDSKADVTLINYNSNSISVFRNTATSGSITGGSLAAKVDFTTGSKPIDIAMGDADGDGKPDIFVTNDWSNSVSVFRNTATSGSITSGSLAANVEFGAASFPYGIAAGDIDGDGKTDIIAANSGSNTISILRNNPLQPITGTLTVCPGTTTTLADATTGGTWSSSNAAVATVGSSTGVVSGVALGTANITYAGTAGPSFTGNIVVVTVTVVALPAAITGSNNVCTGASTTLSSATSGGTWSSSNPTIASIGSATGVMTGASAGTATISYTVSTGCYVTFPVTVNQTPTGISGTFAVCVGLTTTLTNGYGSGVWTSSATGVATVGSSTGVVTGVSGGNSTITYMLPGNCFVTQQVTVNTNPATITGPDNVCVGGNITLANATPSGLFSSSSTGVATIGGGTGLVTGISAGTTNISYTITATGCYTVTPVTVNPLPAAITGTMNVCVGLTTTLSNTTPSGTWMSSNSGIADVGSATGVVLGVSAGNPTISYILSTGCYATTPFTVNPLPAVITGSNTVCVGSNVMLTNTTGTGTWSSSNTAEATIGTSSGIVTGIVAGTPTITYTLPTGCLITRVETVDPLPAAITGVLTACPATTTLLSNTSTGGVWTSNNTGVATIGSGTGLVTGVAAGVSTITYTLPTGCFVTAQVTINPNPATITGSVVVCVNATSALASGSGGGAWSSSNPALGTIGAGTGVLGGISAGNPIITYTLPTGCLTTVTATVNPLPAAIGGTPNVCVGLTTTLTNGSGASTWSSSNNSFATVVSNTGVVTGVAAGTLNITFTLPTGCFMTTPFTVNPTPAAITGTPNVCVGSTRALTSATSGGTWSVSNASASINSTSGVVTGLSPGTLFISYTLPAGCSSTIPFTVNATPPANTGTATVCTGLTTTLSNTLGGGTWSSSHTGQATVVAATGVVTGVSAGNPVITYMVTGACIATTVMTVNPTPSANTGGNNVCVGSTITLANSAGGGTWSSSNANVSVNSTSGAVTGVTAGTVDVSYILPTGCFAVTATTVNSTPAAITGLPTVCTGQTTTLSSITGGGTWSSSNNAVATVNSSGVVTGVTTGTVNITYTTNPGACFQVFAMTVNQTPPAIVGNSNLCIGVPTPLSNGIGGGIWATSNANATIGSASGVATGVTAGTVTITYTLPAGCFATMPATVNNQPAAITGTFTVCETFTTTLGNTSVGGTWTSSAPALGTVGAATGVVGGISAGIPTITYTLPGGCTSTQQVTVNPQPAAITGTAVVCVASTTTLADATFGGIWSSSNPLEATVGSASGIVMGVAAGNPVISYTLPAGCFSLRTLTVNAQPNVFTVTGGGAYCAGGSGVPIGLSGSNGGINYQLYRGTVAVGSPVGGSGSAITFGSQTVAGSYTVLATNTTTGCSINMSGTVGVTVNPLPGVYNVTGGGSYCSGGSGLHIYLSGSAAFGFTYQLYIGGSTPVGLPITGTGVMLDFGLQTAAGTYSVVATNTATGCTRNMLGTPTIAINTLPTAYAVTVTGGGAYCAGGIGQQVGLAFSDAGVNYQLFYSGTPVGAPLAGTGSALNFGYQTAAGTYTIVGTNTTTTCLNSMTGSATIIVNPLPTLYSVTLSGTGSYCAGGTGVSVLLSGSDLGVNYVVYMNGISTGVSLSGTGSPLNFGLFTAAGTYTVIATNTTTFCTNTMSGSPALSINPLPTAFLVTGGGAYCSGGSGLSVGLNGSSIGVSYQLYDASAIAVGGPVSGTGGTISFGLLTAASTYTVVATNPATTCVNNMTGSATITINPLPNIHVVTGGGGYCVGGIGVPVGLASSDPGFDYQLYNGVTAVGLPEAGGSTIAFGNQTVAGTYTVRSTDIATSCVSVMSGSALVTVNPLPVAYNVIGGGSYCSGGTGVAVGISGSEVGVDYELYLDGLTTGIIVSGTGTSVSFGLQTAAGVYTVEAENTSTLCNNIMTGSVSITINPLPIAYTVTGGGNYCSGDIGVHVGLSGSDIGINYQLFDGTATPIGGPLAGTGAALDFGLITAVETYSVTAVSTLTTCTNDMMGSALVATDPLPTIYNVSSGGSYCAGGAGIDITLDNSDPGTNYQLYLGGTPVGPSMPGIGFPISFGMQTTAGTYTVIATNAFGCDETMAGFATIVIDPLPSVFAVTGGGSYCSGGAGVNIGLSGSTVGVQYQLYNGAPVGAPVMGTGLPLNFGVFTSIGVYTVIATNTSTTCAIAMMGTANVTINMLPIAFGVAGGGNYCSGGSGLNVYLGASTIGVNYQLYLGGSPVGGLIPGTSSFLDFGPQTAAGVYTVEGIDATTGCTATMASSATIAIDPLPGAYAVTGGGTICPGGAGVSVGLGNSETGVLYQLYLDGVPVGAPVPGLGAAFSFGLYTGTGTYTVDAVNGTTGCFNTMTGSTTIANYPLPVLYTVTGGGYYCAGGTGVPVALNGSEAGIDYQLWESGTPIGPVMAGTGSPINFGLQTIVGTYTVTATNPVTGCSNTMYSSASVMTNVLPIAQIMTGGGSYCTGGTGVSIGLLNTETGVSYQLYNGPSMVGSPILGTGGGISFGMFTTAGVYSVIGTNVTTLCTNNMANSDTITVSPLPNVYTISGGGSYCAGGAGVNVGLSNSQVGVHYQLFVGSTAASPVVFGTGSTISFGLQTVAGIYTVVANNPGTSCTRTMTGSVTVAINALPTVYTVTGGGGYCTGGTGTHIGLSGSGVGVKYQLHIGTTPVGSPQNGTGASLDFGVHTTAGTYKVVATNIATLCSVDMANTVTIVINPIPTTYTVTGSGTSYCAGGAGIIVYLSGSQVGVNYQLMRGTAPAGTAIPGSGTALDFGPQTIAGTYTVVANNIATGCVSNMTGAASISINTLPSAFTVVGGGNYCPGGTGVHVGLSSSTMGIKYQLYNGGPVGSLVTGTGAAIDFGLQTVTGSYTVVATNTATGCTNNMTGSVTVGINPTPAAFTITGGGGYCTGGTGVNVGLSGSVTGNNYQLYYIGTPLGSAMAGTGLPLNFGLQTTAGTYTIVATNTTTSCTSNMTGSAIVVVNSLPTAYVVTGGGNYCPGGPGVHVGLGSSQAGISYQLFSGTIAAGSPVMGTGSAIDFGIFTTTGSYTVVATDMSTGCQSNMTGSVNVGLNTLPTAYNVIGGGNYCSGTSGVHVGLSNSTTGVTYQLYKDGTPGIIMSGTGLPIDFGFVTITGNYTIVATNSTTMCTSNMTGSATVTMSPTVVPAVSILSSLGDTVCDGNIVNFSAVITNGGSGPLYQWAVNGVNSGTGNSFSYVPTNGDIVGVTLTSSAVCATPVMVNSTMAMTVLPKLMPSVVVSAIPGVIVCEGSVVNFTATPTNGGVTPAYEWKRNGINVGAGTTFSYLPADNDVITCKMTSDYECPLMATVTSSPVTMDVSAPVTPAVIILASPGTEVSAGVPVTLTAMITNTVPFPSYQWSVNGVPVAGATLPSFTSDEFKNLDIVTCAVTSGGGCPGLTGTGTVTMSVVGVGVKQLSVNSDIMLIPNPSKGVFTVKGTLGTNVDEDISLEVINMLGQVVLTQKATTRNGLVDERIQMPYNVANGMYIVNLHAESGNKVFHVVIEH